MQLIEYFLPLTTAGHIDPDAAAATTTAVIAPAHNDPRRGIAMWKGSPDVGIYMWQTFARECTTTANSSSQHFRSSIVVVVVARVRRCVCLQGLGVWWLRSPIICLRFLGKTKFIVLMGLNSKLYFDKLGKQLSLNRHSRTHGAHESLSAAAAAAL